MKFLYMVVVGLLGFTMVTADERQNPLGGFSDVEVNDEEVSKAASTAVATLAGVTGASNPVSTCGKQIELVGVEKAESQVVAGTNYKLTLRLATHIADNCKTKVEKVCNGINVFKSLPHECKGEKSCYELVHQENIKCTDAPPTLGAKNKTGPNNSGNSVFTNGILLNIFMALVAVFMAKQF